jgi:Tfp pilus assembly protein PilV
MTVRHQRSVGAARHRDDGFLLLEVILAVMLLAVSMVAIVGSLSQCLAAARSVQSYSTSEILLANKSFEFRTERPTDLLDQEGEFQDYPGFSWSRKLEETDSDGLWKQTINVYWYERGKLVSDAVVEYRYLPDKQR